jgi:transcriptional regulator with PAS, ATPase and Fis domain
MVRLFRAIERIADARAPVLITGETGTGKDLAARAIHERSARSAGPFVALGCASIPEGMLESELFGAVAGAYTGVDEDRPGLLDHAGGGTLLLDEVSSLSLEAQAKLLRVLDAGTFRPLGGGEERKADVRFLASTSISLEDACEAGRFRRDLYYRLRSVEIRLPPLRERKEDLLYLARHFLSEHARRLGRPTPELTEDALALVEGHSWPGNVRELEGVLFRAIVSRSGGNRIGAADLEPHLSRRAEPLFDDAVIDRHGLNDLKTALERQYLVRLFLRSSGDLERMTKSLGIKRTRLYVWMRRLGIDVRELRKRLRREK